MAEKEDKEALSPEEKLLKVIQGGDEQQEAQQAEEAKETAGTSEQDQAQPPQNIIKENPGQPDKSADTAEEASAVASTPPIAKATVGSDASTFVLISRGLAAGVAVMLALSAMEILGAVRTLQQDQEPAVLMPGTEEPAPIQYTQPLQPLADLMDAITGKPFLRRPGQIETQVVRVDPQPPPPSPPADWQKYVQNNLSLKGFSQLLDGSDATEVIISDDKEQRMFFLRKGQTLLLENIEVELTAVRNDNITLSDGKTSYTLR